MADKLIYFDKNTGLYRASKEEIKNNLKQAVKDAYGDDVLLDDNYPDGIIINDLADKFNNIFDVIESNYNMLDINTAEGVILDTLGNIRNEHRKEATNSKLNLSILISLEEQATEDITCVFKANLWTVIDENNNYWNLVEDVTITIPQGETSASASSIFQSDAKGILQEPTTFTIGKYPSEFPVLNSNIGFTNIGDFIYGENVESDINFRNRLNTYTVFNSITLKENLTDKLNNLSYIKDVKVYYNNSNTDIDTKGELMQLPPANVLILISSTADFITDEDKLNEVFSIIADYKGLGTLCWLPDDPTDIGINYISDDGGVSEFLVPDTLTLSNITISCVKGYAFDNTPSTVEIPGQTGEYYPQSYINVRTLIDVYVSNIGVGQDITTGDLITYLYNNTQEIIVTSATINGQGSVVNNDKILDIDSANIIIYIPE